jgi:uncharacterized protein YlxW (UPF0749 family)
MNNCMPLFYLCLALCGVLMGMLAMFFGYSLKLSARTVKLEQKNGSEQKQINELKARVNQLEKPKNHDHER